jgi:hypothetical protein
MKLRLVTMSSKELDRAAHMQRIAERRTTSGCAVALCTLRSTTWPARSSNDRGNSSWRDPRRVPSRVLDSRRSAVPAHRRRSVAATRRLVMRADAGVELVIATSEDVSFPRCCARVVHRRCGQNLRDRWWFYPRAYPCRSRRTSHSGCAGRSRVDVCRIDPRCSDLRCARAREPRRHLAELGARTSVRTRRSRRRLSGRSSATPAPETALRLLLGLTAIAVGAGYIVQAVA